MKAWVIIEKERAVADYCDFLFYRTRINAERDLKSAAYDDSRQRYRIAHVEIVEIPE